MKLIVGLGNPGLDYAKTRHNVGFMTVDRLADDGGVGWSKTRYGLVCRYQDRFLLKPLTYMNRSGDAVAAMMQWHRWNTDQVMVVADDLDLPLGRIRIRVSGSSGGHNGLKSIIERLGTEAFLRLKIGIGRPPQDFRVIDWVLQRFSKDEWPVLEDALKRAQQALEVTLTEGVEPAMNRFNH